MATKKYCEYVWNKKNGPTLIYQHNKDIKGYQVSIGFKGGASLDFIPGIAHLIEHLLFKGTTANQTDKITHRILRDTVGFNAMTFEQGICVNYTATKGGCLERFTDFIVNRFNNRTFSNSQIKNEINVIKNEIAMDKDHGTGHPILDQLIIWPTNKIDILGNFDDLLKTVTPKLIREWMDRYFNSNNLIISISTADSFESVKKFCEERIVPHFQKASNELYIAQPPTHTVYDTKNLLLYYPNPNASNITVSFIIRERALPLPPDFPKELEHVRHFYDENIFNDLGGILHHTLRTEKPLVYAYGIENIAKTNSAFKFITACTNEARLPEVIESIAGLIKKISEKGMDKKYFDATKNALIDLKDVVGYPAQSAYDNFVSKIFDYPHIDQEKVRDLVHTMTYNDYNTLLQTAFALKNVSLSISGNFDPRKCPNLVELEEMLGKDTNSPFKANLNVPKKETTGMLMTPEEIYEWTYIRDSINKAHEMLGDKERINPNTFSLPEVAPIPDGYDGESDEDFEEDEDEIKKIGGQRYEEYIESSYGHQTQRN